MRLLIEASADILAGASGEGSPVIEPLSVEFNGKGTASHEPFAFPSQPGFNLCKTSGKRYDEVVVACLLVASDHFPDDVLTIASDGGWSDWKEGAALYGKVLGRSPTRPAGLASGGLGVWTWLLPLVLLAVVAGPWWWRARRGPRFQPRGRW